MRDIKFPPEKDAFYTTLKHRVNAYFSSHRIEKIGNPFFHFKAISLLVLHLILYALLLYSNNFWIAFMSMVAMGPSSILIGINIAHDAAHQTIFKRKALNDRFLLLFDLLGANSYMWKNRHVFSHHTFPNILDSDADLKQNPLVRIFPNDELKSYHRFQYLYAPFLYLLYTMNWLLFRDFQDFTAKQIGSFRPKVAEKRKAVVQLIFFKAFYIFYIIILPIKFSVLSLPSVLLAYIFMNFGASLLITLALIPSHVAEHSFFPLPNAKGIMPHSWSHHQVLTVTDFATNNRFLNFFFGGFNHHVTHHLFPNICHVHYPKITPIVKQTALDFGLKYQHEESFFNAYISHYKLLKANGSVN